MVLASCCFKTAAVINSYFQEENMKKISLVLAGMILAVSAFAGGQKAVSAEDSMTGELRITVQAWMLDRYDFQKIKADFEANHPGVTVVLNKVDNADVTTNMLQWAQGKTDCDIAIGGSREHAVQYAARDFIVPFEDSWFNGDYSKDKWFPAFLELGNVEGTQYMIPFTGEVMFIVANKQLMKDAGIADVNGNIPVPKDWNELYNYAGAATIKEGGRVRQTGLSIDWGSNFMMYSYLAALQGIKGNFYEADKKTMDFSSPQAGELLSQWVRLVKNGYTPTDTFADMDAGRSNFKAGKVAMLLTAASRWIECQSNVGEGNTTVIPIPGTDREGSLVYIHGAVIPKVSPRIELAKIFIKESLLNDDLHRTALNTNGKMSPLLRHYAKLQNPDWPTVVKATQTAVTTPLYKDFSKLDLTAQAEIQKCIIGSQSVQDTQKRLADFIKTLDLTTGLKR
jgi:ABC-type glycerol-3-phosphate transport system substrate-binding protein